MAEMDLAKELAGLFRANVPLINLITYEEERVIRTIEKLESKLGVYTWDLADGFHVVREAAGPMPKKELNSETLLPFLSEQAPPGCVIVLKDFHHAWNQRKGFITRKLRNMAPGLRAKNQFLVMITPVAELPVELKDDVMVFHVPLPDREELGRLFDDVTRNLPKGELPRREVREKLIGSALGVTTNQARLAFSRVYAQFGRFDDRGIQQVTWAKREVIRESGALEFWPAEEGESSVGGLDLLKDWLAKRELAFSEEARKAQLPFPRGVALIGIPGTGKSLSAKMTSGVWKLPLLRLDGGAVFASLLGESEQNMRRAIQLAETVSPCILWVDEMEKAFAGSGAGTGSSSGAASRVFGTFLTWMQERKSPVYVIATANEVAALPMELMGRFDRTFFLDLPNAAERKQIFIIHLKRAGVDFPERRLRLNELVESSRGFVGREIERVVREAQFTAFADGNRELEQADVEASLVQVIPISKSHAGVIDELRRWKKDGLASPASSEETAPKVERSRMIETE
ncbi:MAG: AAA family ATPase [Acidobacteria bacterium]|nr:AAA family ATPase [Acidobacteriota bacterium]MBI3656838.1 AAA family ATPase [Acidobacteriota bacterium]